jgi:hypothetical protein
MEGGVAMAFMEKTYRTIVMVCASAIVLALTGCGGGTASSAPVSTNTTPQQYALLTLSTSGTLPSDSSIGGLGITVELPDTVSVRTTGSSVASGVVTASGVATGQATLLSLYSGATVTAPAKLYLVLAGGSAGLQVGEFAKITVIVKQGSTPVASDFGVRDFSAVDTSGVAIPTITASLTETLK